MGLRYNWSFPNYSLKKIDDIKQNFNLSDNTAKILNSQNINDIDHIKEILVGEYDEGFDPFLINDMQKAVDRINIAIDTEEKILVYGDYDADGITSTVLLLETLISLGANVSSYIPNRFEEGYGPNKTAFEKIIKSGVTLIITVDNGIAAIDEIEFANQLGCDVIITDHHKIQYEIPNAFAVIHPEHPLAQYPFGKLAGVGVAFKLAHALLDIYPDFLLDLVAIGTVADLVPMVSENRIFVKQGLTLLNEDTRLGIKLLLDLASHNGKIDEQTIGFVLAPRLNAIGRITSAKDGLLLLTSDNSLEAQELAKKIEHYNTERKDITLKIIEDIEKHIDKKLTNNLLVLVGDDYHEGVLGIVASNIVEKYKKPALVISKKDNILKGSARSINNFDIYKAMNEISDLFNAFGGHTMAAGFSTTTENIKEIEEKLNQKYTDYILENKDLKSTKHISLICHMDDISYQLLNDVNILSPFGNEFEKPLILIEDVNVIEKIYFGSNNQYLKIIIGNPNDKLECISFKDNTIFDTIQENDTISVLATIDKNSFNGRTKLQILIEDIEIKNYLFKDYRNYHIDFNTLNKAELKLSNNFSDIENNYYTYKEFLNNEQLSFDIINILDIPKNKEDVKLIISKNPKSIHLFCKQIDVNYKKYLIDKNRLIKLFNILLKVKQIDTKDNATIVKIIKLLNTNIESFKIMLNIFMELNFIIKTNHYIKINDDYKIIKLENSKTFMNMNSIFENEKFFLEENIQNINKILCNN